MCSCQDHEKWKDPYLEKVSPVLRIHIICITSNNIAVDSKETCDFLISHLNVFDFPNSSKYHDNADAIKFTILRYAIQAIVRERI